MASAKQEFPEELPSLHNYKPSITVAGLDNVQQSCTLNHQSYPTGTPTSNPSPYLGYSKSQTDSSRALDSHQMCSISISMPSSPLGLNIEGTGKVPFSHNVGIDVESAIANSKQSEQANFRSQPRPAGTAYAEETTTEKLKNPSELQHNPRVDRFKDKRFDSFKTWSGKLERQLSHFRGKQQESEQEGTVSQDAEIEALPVHRYFDALEGPELETLRDSEELVLPKDKQWPFLLRFPISSFSICLGVSSQAILWKTLATSESMSFLHVSLDVNLVLWCISVAVTCIVSFIYSLKLIFYFEAVRREYYHPIRVNFFFAPWVSLLFLALGIPPTLAKYLHVCLWYILMTPVLCLELKIYGQWMSGGQRRLSKVANPSNHLSIIGNFVGALLGASMGLKEGPIFFFAVGLAHYLVLFVTLYQRLPTNATLPKELHPVFFLFVAAPSVASMAWARIQGTFGYGSRISFFIALFLYCSLAVRINFFRGFRFSLAWWAYTFPMTGASVATIKYSNEVRNPVTQSLSVILSAISTFTVTALLISTVYHAFVLRNLFPNDIVIAIAQRRTKKSKKQFHRSSKSSKAQDNESSLTSAGSDTKDIESSISSSVSRG
ncbi:Voltage-dependent anion channel [Macleaya cordata]|uniref:Voltage-dependent anion channel n=1 Tax=Macleaya cordata TaxID=56857 RepID=A0A200R2M2_MACCD|nr:Voltage-dependent anion channel [Macleaya cordata]OVA16928.1 Voltage-dependent anion channel [Macleaya cordata]